MAWNTYFKSQGEAKKDEVNYQRKSFDKEKRLQNKQEVIDANNEDFKNKINTFLHNNIDKSFNAINADIPAFKASMNGQAIPGTQGYLQRWKHIVASMLATKSYKQSDAQTFLNKSSQNALGGNFSGKPQGNKVIVDNRDFQILKTFYPNEFTDEEKKQTGNVMVDKKLITSTKFKNYLKETGQKINGILTKTSDYTLKDLSGTNFFVSFKEVRNQGGSQTNQIADIIKTLQALKNEANNKSIAVISGNYLENKVQVLPNGTTIFLNFQGKRYEFKPINFAYKKKEDGSFATMTIPRVMTHEKWLKFLSILKKEGMKNV